MRLGIIIKKYRTEHNISMDEFARRTGLSKAYIGMLEKGVHPKTGKVIRPSVDTIRKAAIGMRLEFSTLFNMMDEEITLNPSEDETIFSATVSVRIPVLGRVPAGDPADAVEDILDYENIPESMAAMGEYYGLVIRGDSMEPMFMNGDVVIVLKQETAENGDVVIAAVGDTEAICKKLILRNSSILLHPLNPAYKDLDVTKDSSFRILGVVKELRRRNF